MLKILFSANKAVTKSSDMKHNYSWLSESVRNCMCSEPQLWHCICWSSDYSFCQAHASPSACHDTGTHWHRSSAVSAGSDHRSLSGLFPVPIYTSWRWGNQTCAVFETQGSHRYRGTAKVLTVSFTPSPGWSHTWFTFLFWTFSTHFYGTDRSLLLSVSHLQPQFKPTWQLSAT